jgi:hypothetical protein
MFGLASLGVDAPARLGAVGDPLVMSSTTYPAIG